MSNTNGELGIMIDGLTRFMEEKFDETNNKVENFKFQVTESINRVEAQTVKHNGRMTAVERVIEQCKGGAKIVGVLVIGVILPLFIYIYHGIISRIDHVQSLVENTRER